MSRRAQRVWDRLASWYGTRLVDQYGKHPPEDWCGAIDRTDDERLEQGLLAVRRSSPVHPPTLGQLEAALPKRRFSGSKSVVEVLADFATKKFARDLCCHQLARPWTYFGSAREDDSEKPNGQIDGVVIPECAECGKASHRALVNEIVDEQAA